MTRHPLFGLALAVFGTLVLSPDTLFMRWSAMSGFQMLAWRGLSMGGILLAFWLLAGAPGRAALIGPAGLTIILCHTINATLFSLGIAIAPVPVVLFAVAVSPIFAAIFGRVLLGEVAGRATWIATAAVLTGIFIAILGRDTGDIAAVIAGRGHDLADPAGVEILQLCAPFEIADPALRIAVARAGPALDMLAAHGNAQQFGSVGGQLAKRLRHAAAINQFHGLAGSGAARIG